MKDDKSNQTSQTPRIMTGAELKSLLKSSINFKSLGGVKCPELNLKPEDKKWWADCKIGLFVHWGLYSILGHGEWARFNEAIPENEYDALADEFIPKDFDPGEWVEIAKDFGARYMVMVTKHHDGFSLWNSEGSHQHFDSYHRAAHRDFVKEYVEACRESDIKVGLYYSPMDWRFPGYFDPKGEDNPENKDNALLMKKQCYAQVEELSSRFRPDILWYDGAWLAHEGSDTSSAWFWEPAELNKISRAYNPKMLINPRSGWEGDFYCDEGSHEINGKIIPVPWEKNMCICSGSSWGWMENDPVSDFDWLIRMMVNVVCRGGNWLVNIGPDRNGKISSEIRQRIHEIGEWLRCYGESIYGTEAGPLEPVDGIYGSTFNKKTIYLHVLDCEAIRSQIIPLKYECIESISAMDERSVEVHSVNNGIVLSIEDAKTPDTIVVINVKNKIEKENLEIYFSSKD